MEGLSPDEVDRRAHQPAQPGEARVVYRRRRHVGEHAGAEPMPMDRWAQSGFIANANRTTSGPHEEAVLAHLGAVRNNGSEAEGGQRTHQYTEYVDRNGRSLGSTVDPHTGEPRPIPDGAIGARQVEARPDGYIENEDGTIDIVEHKHLMDADGGTFHDSPQLRAEREMAQVNGGEHVLVLTGEAGLDESGQPRVHVSDAVASGSTVLYYDAPSGTMLQLSASTGRFVPYSPSS
jgi:hypothetical protein